MNNLAKERKAKHYPNHKNCANLSKQKEIQSEQLPKLKNSISDKRVSRDIRKPCVEFAFFRHSEFLTKKKFIL